MRRETKDGSSDAFAPTRQAGAQAVPRPDIGHEPTKIAAGNTGNTGDTGTSTASNTDTLIGTPGAIAAAGATPSRPRSPQPGNIPVGTNIGRYQVSGLLGVGGMGAVYAAFDPQLNRRVALKVLHYAGRDATQRIQREAQALAKLSHPNVVAVYDSGSSSNGFFIVMQYVEGTTLDVWLKQRPVNVPEIVQLYAAAGTGLAAAHAVGLVHRDFKAQNVLVDSDGHVAVTDFGVARSDDSAIDPPQLDQASQPPSDGKMVLPWHNHGETTENSQEQLTQVGMLVGTPFYMAPEQHQGKSATALSDQFAFCVSMWESLFHQHPLVPAGLDLSNPFAAGVAILDGIIIEPPANHRVPASLVRLLRRGLLLDPTLRWPSMQALLAELVPPVRRSHWPLIGAGVITVAAAGIALWALSEKSTPNVDPATQCVGNVQSRIAPIWSDAAQSKLQQAFTASGAPFAASTIESTQRGLRNYTSQLQRLQTDLCVSSSAKSTAEAATKHAAQQACSDQALMALGTTVQSFTNHPNAILIANATEVIEQLPRLQDCENGVLGQANATVPPTIAAQSVSIHNQLISTRVMIMSGELTEAKTKLAALVTQAKTIAWPPLQTEIQAAQAQVAVATQDREFDQSRIVAIASDATAAGQDRLASEVWSMATVAAGIVRNEQAARTSAAIAMAIARKLKDDKLVLNAQIALGRALVQSRAIDEGRELCKASAKIASKAVDADVLQSIDANTCVVEALAEQARWADVATLVTEQKPLIREAFGDDHPTMAAWLIFEYSAASNAADYRKARALLAQARAIFTRVYGENYIRTLQTQQFEANCDYWEDKSALAAPKLRALLAKLEQRHNSDVLFAARVHSDLAVVEYELRDKKKGKKFYPPKAKAEMDKALELARSAGPAGVRDVALLQVYDGQFQCDVTLEPGVYQLREAYETLRRINDPRANWALAAYAITLYVNRRYSAALPLLERALTDDNAKDLTPYNLGMIRYMLAQNLAALKLDPARVRALATLAIQDYQRAGYLDHAKDVEGFLKKQR